MSNAKPKVEPAARFGAQMAQSMAELQAIMDGGQSPTANGRLTVRTIEVAEPGAYNAAAVQRARASLGVSQAVFARLVGVSDVLVRSWERGARQPAPVACRLLDQIAAHPRQFTSLIRRTNGGPPKSPVPARGKARSRRSAS